MAGCARSKIKSCAKGIVLRAAATQWSKFGPVRMDPAMGDGCTEIPSFPYRQGLVRKSYLFRIAGQAPVPQVRKSA